MVNYYDKTRSPVIQADGRVLGRIRPGVKLSRPSERETDYRFFVEPLSPLPKGFEEAKGYGFTGFMNQLGYALSTFSTEEEAEKELQRSFGDSYVTFTPLIRNHKYFVVGELVKEHALPAIKDEQDFIPIPVFGDENNQVFGGDVNQFCYHILHNKPLPGLSKKFWDFDQNPPFIVMDTGIKKGTPSRYMFFSPVSSSRRFDEVSVGEGGAYFKLKSSPLSYGWIDFSDEETGQHILRCHNTPLWFMSRETAEKICKQGMPVPDDGDIMKKEHLEPKETLVMEAKETILHKPEEELSPQEKLDRTVQEMMADKKPAARTKKPQEAADSQAAKAEPAAEMEKSHEPSEHDFVSRFISRVRERGYLYDTKDLCNFHVSMKSSRLVILAGMSGTGKSGLVRLYGEALGLPAEQVAFLPVKPSWMDDSDILGYLDWEHMVYRPADTGLADLLVEASQHPDKLYIVCFDEMNLARVEHYFAQFISVLEKENNRVIRLYNPALSPRVYNSSRYPAEIPVGHNIIFTGTVNVDESTFHFSDKVLDRANVITLKQGKFTAMKHLRRVALPRGEEISASVYQSFRQATPEMLLSEKELAFLDALNEAFENSGVNCGIGYRVAIDLNHYLANIPEGFSFTRREGLDCQAVQRILTKIRGSAEQLRHLVYCTEDGQVKGSLMDVLDAYREVSDFEECRSALKKKARELALYDYTI